MKKKTLSVLLSLIVTLSIMISYTGVVMADPMPENSGSSTTEEEGGAGTSPVIDPNNPNQGIDEPDGISWKLKDGNLTISGTGAMPDFKNCSDVPWYSVRDSITSITIEEGITYVGKYAFNDCSNVTNVSFPDSSLKSIGPYAFQGSRFKNINIPDSVTAIGDRAFCNNFLVSITLPKTIETVGNEAFCDSYNLPTIDFSGSSPILGEGVFQHSYIKSVDLSNANINTIPSHAFAYCNSLTEITLPESVTLIRGGAFAECISLEKIYISADPSKLNWEETGEFDSCKKCIVPNEYYDDYVAKFSYLDLTFEKFTRGGSNCGDNLTWILERNGTLTVSGTGAMYDYTQGTQPWAAYNLEIKSIVIENGVTSIGDYAFYDCCELRSVTLSDTITRIGSNAFGEIITGTGVHLYGYNLSLAGDVGVNFWFQIDMYLLDPDNYIKFTVNGKEQIVKVSEATNGTNGAKVFRCGVAAKEMTDTITAQFYRADGTAVGNPYSYTVRDYANYILKSDGYSQKAKDLVKAMLNYGACSQVYFKYKTDSLANAVLSSADRDVAILTSNEIKNFKDVSFRSVVPAKVSLSLKSEIYMKLYFNTADVEGMEFRQYYYPIDVETHGKYTVVTIKDISALWINSAARVDVYKDGVLYDYVEYCPMKYCQLAIDAPSSNVVTDDLKRVVSSLYLYNIAAQEYKQSVNLA
ncbi:MAG: leucine-rich repeat domain-containing protein [Paludibacteraceae bacterium]|nr:leucine-rich repeat domain-containing protein [Paludibacteraceae bacterium]